MRVLFLLGLLIPAIFSNAQNPNVKFGKVNPADFATKVYSIDSSANAVIIAEIGSTEIVGNNKGWFSLIFKKYKRVHILNKNGYDEATVDISLYTSGNDEEKLENLKAVTYNMENGKVVETKLEKSNVFTEKVNKQVITKKFTLPNVKEGSIIEYEYRISSDFLFNLQPWAFQGENPRLWSEYRLSLPQFLNYVFLAQGYQAFHIKESKESQTTYTVLETAGTSASERYDIKSNVTDSRWVMKDVPALKTESYTSSIANHISKIEFQLSAYQYPLTYRKIMGTWPELTRRLLEDEDFGKNLNTANNWLNDVMKDITAGAATDMEKAQKIFSYVRENISCTSHYARYASQQLKNVLKTRAGNVSDVNLLLTAMLKDAKIDADPVILSMRPRGVTYALYPIIDRFNYVISKAVINGQTYYLDASHPNLGFGKLLPDCYNGHARVVNEEATAIELYPEQLSEKSMTTVFITNDDKGKWIGSMTQKPGYLKSYSIRNEIQKSGKENFFSNIKKEFGTEISLQDQAIDSLTNYNSPVVVRCNFGMSMDNEDILYVNPVFEGGWKENPFKSAQRFYPVEMPYTFDETYMATIEVPAGYVLDELPKPIKVKYNEEGEGMFEYLVSHSGNTISLRTRVYLKRATFLPEEYEILREFFTMIVNKHKEQIVFKKKK